MSRPLRMLASLIVLWACYWLYSLFVVPLVEPQAAAQPRPVVHSPPSDVQPPVPTVVEILRPYFPPDAPELRNPIVLETPNFTLLLTDYKTVAERQVQIKPCTMAFFPDGLGTVAEPGRVIIMRAPGGALLDFDDQCDFTRAKFGRILGGKLVGEVRIEGNIARGAAAGDPAGKLVITTRDVQISQQRIWTPHDVSFELGKNRGSGSDMQILLATAPAGKRNNGQAMPQGIESFQLLRDVRLTADIGSGGLIPGAKRDAAAPAGGAATQSLEVRCQGAFRFDMADYVATFENHVDVQRLNPMGPADSLSCELLAIHCARGETGPDLRNLKPKKPLKAAGAVMPQADGAAHGDLAELRRAGAFSVTTIKARGNPVIIHAVTPQGEAEARGEHVQYNVETGGLLVEGDEKVALRFGQQQIMSKLIRYTPSPDGQSAEALAEGQGTFSGTLPGEEGRRIAASWTRQLSLRPHDGKQLLSVLGNAKLQYADLGSLAGEEIWLWLVDEGQMNDRRAGGVSPPLAPRVENGGRAPSRSDGRPSARHNSARYRPHSMLCVGNVQVDSPQMVGRTERLEVWFRQAALGQAAVGAAEGGAGVALQPRAGASSARYELASQKTRVQFVLGENQQPVLRDVALTGNVTLSELPPPGTADRPLKLNGDDVQLLGADTTETTLTVAGQPARIEARGLGLSGAKVNYDKAAGRLWIDGQGAVTLMVPAGELDRRAGGRPSLRDGARPPFSGREVNGGLTPPARQTPVTIEFASGVNFDGRTARFDGPIVVHSAERRLQTPQLLVRLSQPIDLTRPQPGSKPELEKITCVGSVLMENRTLTPDGQVASIDRLQAADLSIEQPSGDLSAKGPGWASTIRLGGAAELKLPMPGGGGAPAPAPAARERKLTCVKVTFQQGITGNVNRREATFADQVACIYGLTPDWKEELTIPRVGDLTPDQLLLTCDRITVNDLGPAASSAPDSGPAIELQALGGARINSTAFTAEGDRLTYSADKQLLTMEGGQADAHLWKKGPNGETTSHAAYRKILYWKATNRMQVDGIRTLEHNLSSGQR